MYPSTRCTRSYVPDSQTSTSYPSIYATVPSRVSSFGRYRYRNIVHQVQGMQKDYGRSTDLSLKLVRDTYMVEVTSGNNVTGF